MARRRSSDAGSIGVEGLNSLSKALKEIGPEAQKELKTTNKEVATEEASNAKAAAYSLGGVAAHAAPSIKASAGAAFAGISIGNSAHPEAAGAEFGGGSKPTTRQFQPWRGSGESAGYFVYPTIRRDGDKIVSRYTEMTDALIRRYLAN